MKASSLYSVLLPLLLTCTSTVLWTGASEYDYLDLYGDPGAFPYTQRFASKADFEERVMRSDELWVVQFYAPWDDYEFECEDCADLAVHWERAARLLRGVAKLGVVDALTPNRFGRNLASRFIGRENQMDNVNIYPRILVFGYDKTKPVLFRGQLLGVSEEDGGPSRPLVAFILNQIGDLVTRRAAGGSDEGKKTDEDKAEEYLFQVSEVADKHPNLKVTTGDTMANDLKEYPINIVAVVAAWDINSKVFLEKFVEASYVLQNSGVGLFVLEGSDDRVLVSKFKISSYPHILSLSYVSTNTTQSSNEEKPTDEDNRIYLHVNEYEGALNTKELVAYVYKLVDDFLDRDAEELAQFPPLRMDTPRLTSPQMFRDTCTVADDDDDAGRYCVLIVLPVLHEDQPKSVTARQTYLSTVRKVRKKLQTPSSRTQFLFTEWREQPPIEKTLGIKDLPATVVLHLNNNEFLIQPPEKSKNGGFSVNGITRFVKMATGGRMQKKMKEIMEGEENALAFTDMALTLEMGEEEDDDEDENDDDNDDEELDDPAVPDKDEL